MQEDAAVSTLSAGGKIGGSRRVSSRKILTCTHVCPVSSRHYSAAAGCSCSSNSFYSVAGRFQAACSLQGLRDEVCSRDGDKVQQPVASPLP